MWVNFWNKNTIRFHSFLMTQVIYTKEDNELMIRVWYARTIQIPKGRTI